MASVLKNSDKINVLEQYTLTKPGLDIYSWRILYNVIISNDKVVIQIH